MHLHLSFLVSLLCLALQLDQCCGQNASDISYAPYYVECPSDVQFLRPAIGLHPDEAAWVHGRKRVVLKSLSDYLRRLELESFNVCEYVGRLRASNHSSVPTLAFATSGGGWASAFTGVGGLRALDARLPAALEQKTGGLLQSLTYLSGQSGGNFPTFSMPLNSFPTVDELVQIWQPQIDRFSATNNSKYAETTDAIFMDIADKFEAGFNISTSDFFARIYGYEFIPGPRGGAQTTFSSLLELEAFRNHSMPMPMGLASEVLPDSTEYFGLKVPATNGSANLYEMTPFEFGSWQGSKSFAVTKWLGTRLIDGSPVNSNACVNNFDNAGFMIGSAAAAENFWLIEGLSNYTLAPFSKRSQVYRESQGSRSSLLRRNQGAPPSLVNQTEQLIAGFQSFGLSNTSVTYAPWPNPFYQSKTADSSSRQDLNLVDATEVGQGIPLWGFIQPARTADFIFAWESDQDTEYSWNNGTNLRDTYLAAKAAGLPFPVVPPVSTIINRGYNLRPTFFGCDANLTTTGDGRGPIVALFANAPYSSYTNFSFTQSGISFAQTDDIFLNSFNLVTGGNGTFDREWPACLGCAAIDRSLAKVDMQRTAQCEKCMQKYCWDGSLDERTPKEVDPSLLLDPGLGYAQWNATRPT